MAYSKFMVPWVDGNWVFDYDSLIYTNPDTNELSASITVMGDPEEVEGHGTMAPVALESSIERLTELENGSDPTIIFVERIEGWPTE